MIPRATILPSLVLTLAVPLTGFALYPASVGVADPVAKSEVSVLETIDAAAAANLLEGATSTGTALLADPAAPARAAESAPRAQARTDVSVCEPVVGASGLREAYTERESVVYLPMVEGTYHNTSLYGPRWGSFHPGVDFAAPVGTPIHAIADGEVVWAGGGKEGRSGQLVIIHHVINGQDVWSWYGHMYTDGVHVAEGDRVRAGQLIAEVGNNGYSTGPHLHFEIHTGEMGNHVDPLTFLAGAGGPVAGEC
ncbi:MAG: M23 family metallopeptidase [Actinomycetales bacterium]|nr:M23 family metallopeptidase [Actinomycetales bacterium]